jgi:glycosyltransferase involved in cell wall biosynthesis
MAAHKVTIVIPTYQQKELIRNAVKSALMQDYTPLEVIVCDDSIDSDTRETLSDLINIDERLRYVKNSVRLGRVGNYRNALYNYVSGEWALTLDGDDYLIDGRFISDAMKAINNQSHVVFVQGGGEIRRLTGEDLSKSFFLSTRIPKVKKRESFAVSGAEYDVVRGVDYVNEFPKKRFFLHLSSLFHVETAKAIGFYRNDLLSSDLDSFMRLALHGNVLLLKRPVGVWLQHTHNAGKNATLEDIIQNSRWAEDVAQYAIERHFFNKGEAKRWKIKVQNVEIIGGFIKELQGYIIQKWSLKEIGLFILRFVKRFPRMMIHPVFVKKVMVALFKMLESD